MIHEIFMVHHFMPATLLSIDWIKQSLKLLNRSYCMKTIMVRLGLICISLFIPVTGALASTPNNHKMTCEQVGGLALKIMDNRQSTKTFNPTESFMSWEDKILSAGISLRAAQVLISSDPDESLESIVKFGESIYSECKSGKLGLLQQYVGSQVVIKNKTSTSVEMLITELLGRISMLEQEYESITEFRQATNVKLNNIRTQINALAYGADSGVLKQSAEAQQPLNSLLVDDRVSTDSSELIAAGNYIRNEIEQKWVMPANAVPGMVVELVIQLLPSGEVISIEVSYRDASATDSFVSSVIRAVKKVQSFSKLSQLSPALFDANFRKFTLKFKPEDLRI